LNVEMEKQTVLDSQVVESKMLAAIFIVTPLEQGEIGPSLAGWVVLLADVNPVLQAILLDEGPNVGVVNLLDHLAHNRTP